MGNFLYSDINIKVNILIIYLINDVFFDEFFVINVELI